MTRIIELTLASDASTGVGPTCHERRYTLYAKETNASRDLTRNAWDVEGEKGTSLLWRSVEHGG